MEFHVAAALWADSIAGVKNDADHFGKAARAKFFHDLGPSILDRAAGNLQLGGDFGMVGPSQKQIEDVGFRLAQLLQASFEFLTADELYPLLIVARHCYLNRFEQGKLTRRLALKKCDRPHSLINANHARDIRVPCRDDYGWNDLSFDDRLQHVKPTPLAHFYFKDETTGGLLTELAEE